MPIASSRCTLLLGLESIPPEAVIRPEGESVAAHGRPAGADARTVVDPC